MLKLIVTIKLMQENRHNWTDSTVQIGGGMLNDLSGEQI